MGEISVNTVDCAWWLILTYAMTNDLTSHDSFNLYQSCSLFRSSQFDVFSSLKRHNSMHDINSKISRLYEFVGSFLYCE